MTYPSPQQHPPSYQPYQYVPVAPIVTKTSGLAVASLVLGILWLYWVGSILAVIFSFVALSQMKKNPTIGGRGMAVAGMVLGWIGVATLIFFLLIGAAASGS